MKVDWGKALWNIASQIDILESEKLLIDDGLLDYCGMAIPNTPSNRKLLKTINYPIREYVPSDMDTLLNNWKPCDIWVDENGVEHNEW